MKPRDLKLLAGWVAILVILNCTIAASLRLTGHPFFGRVAFLLFVSSTFDFIGAAISAKNTYRMRWTKGGDEIRLAWYYMILMWAFVAFGIGELVANLDPPKITGYTVLWSCIHWSGRWTVTYAIWMLALFQGGKVNGIKH